MTFTNLDPVLVSDVFVFMTDMAGGSQGFNDTLRYDPQSGTATSLSMDVEDRFLGGDEWLKNWDMDMWLWIPYADLGTGNVYPYYLHDYNDTRLSNVEFTGGGQLKPNEWGLSGGVKAIFNLEINKWGGQALPTAY